MGFQLKKAIALLDVDNTLAFSSPEFNDNLIHVLLQNGVKDVYLFSSMSLKEDTIKDRNELINYLQRKGLKVHGVICASDLIWQKDKNLITEFYNAMTATKTDAELFDLFNQEKFQSLTQFNDAIPGQAFSAVTGQNNVLDQKEAGMYQMCVSAIRQYLKQKDTSKHAVEIAKTEKSYFYEMFVRNKPAWSGDIIFIDDASDNIDAVKGMHEKLNPEYKLLTLVNRNEKKQVKNTIDFYNVAIAPFVQLAFSLFNSFNNYKYERRFTHSTVKHKILEQLGQDLETCKNTDAIAAVKMKFNENYKQLNSHRFSIWSNDKTRSAMTFDDMVLAREAQLKMS